MNPTKFINLDANETIFFERELEYIKSRAYEVIYSELKAVMHIPVSNEAGPGAETITYQQFTKAGFAKMVANLATDIPRVDVGGQEFTSKVRSIVESYGYSLQDIRASQFAGKNLPQRKANAARRANDQKVDSTAWFGDTKNDITGLLYNANITKTAAAKTWATATAAEILTDLNNMVINMIDANQGNIIPNRLLLPPKQWSQIFNTPRSNDNDTSIGKWFMDNNPGIVIDFVAQFKNVNPRPSDDTSNDTDVALLFKADPEVLTLEIPQDFEQLPVQEQGLEYVTNCHSRCGGVIVYQPLGVYLLDSI
jgi:hypothetical protein